jgi:hypothetical protein
MLTADHKNKSGVSISIEIVRIFWKIAPCSPYVIRCFGGTHHLYLQGRKSDEQEISVQQMVRHNILV